MRHRLAREAARKALHVLATVAGALVLLRLQPHTAQAAFIAAATLALVIDLARLRRLDLHERFEHALAPMLRAREGRHLTGATTLAFGFAATVLLFPTRPALAGLLYGGLADAAAAVVGRAFGRRRIRGGRTVEGSVAFYITAFAIGVLVPGLPTASAALVALALALLELLPLPFDDNVVVPLAAALLVSLASSIA